MMLSDPTYINTGDKLFSSLSDNFVYNNIYYYTGKGEHYVIEGYVPRSAFGVDWGRIFACIERSPVEMIISI